MGTNYYVRTPTCEAACAHCGQSELLHLGKSSAGWRFSFQADPEWPRDQAYRLWLERAKSGVIEDEYGDAITLDELLAFVEKKQAARGHTDHDPDQPRSALYDSLRASNFVCEGWDFCDRPFT